MKKLIIIFLIVLSVLAYMQIKGWIAASGPLLNVTNVVVPKGASLKTVAEELSRAGVIDKPWLFRIMARINGLAKHLKAGEYQFMPGISLQAAMDKIARGEVFFRRITIPEGLTSGQIMYLIANYPDLEGEIDLDVKEGELLPETYSFELGASRNSIILQARAAMQKALEEVWASRDSSLPLKDVNELLTLASIIEKETGVPEERPLVASVFLNRLKKGKPYSIVVVAEGIQTDGKKRAAEYIAQEIEYETGIETRETVLGYIQRGGSPTPFDRNLSTRMGGHATELIAGGQFGRMVTLKGNEISSAPLGEIAGKLKLVTEDHDLVVQGKRMGICFG